MSRPVCKDLVRSVFSFASWAQCACPPGIGLFALYEAKIRSPAKPGSSDTTWAHGVVVTPAQPAGRPGFNPLFCCGPTLFDVCYACVIYLGDVVAI